MLDKNKNKEDATKQLIDLLRDSDEKPEKGGFVAPKAEEKAKKVSGKDEPAVETQNSLMDFLNQVEGGHEDHKKEVPKKDIEKVVKVEPSVPHVQFDISAPEPEAESEPEAEEKDAKQNLIDELYHDEEVFTTDVAENDTAGIESEKERIKTKKNSNLQALLANLDDNMNVEDEPEILGGGSGRNANSTTFKTETFTSEAQKEELFSSQAGAKVDEKPEMTDNAFKTSAMDNNSDKRPKKILKEFDYNDLYISEKKLDEDSSYKWNATEFFKSVMFQKDTAIGFDYGDDFVRYIELKKRQDSLEISSWGYTQIVQADSSQNPNYVRKQNEENFSSVFNQYVSQITLRSKYFSYAIQNKNVISRIFSIPKLKANETRNAILMNSKKNLPFPEKYAQIDFAEAGVSGETQKKINYMVGITHERTINSVVTRFKDANVVPRKIFSCSFSIWSLFKNNYPDREEDSVILLYMGEDTSNIIFVNEGLFQFDREISIGNRDFREALAQKVNTPDGDYNINIREAEKLKTQYGFPIDQEGVTEFSHIEAFRLLILLRAVGERLISEINRSMDFYRKLYSLPPLDSDLYIAGPGAKIPNLDKYMSQQLNRIVHRINPLRGNLVKYADNCEPIPVEFLPELTLAISAATELENHTNLVPKSIKFEEKFIPPYMASILILLLSVLAITVSSFAISAKVNSAVKDVETFEAQISDIAPMGKKYTELINYNNIAQTIKNEMGYDRYNSQMVIGLAKMVSNTTQEEIKITQFIINQATATTNPKEDKKEKTAPLGRRLYLEGFVSTSSSIADVVLANYIIKLENSGYFASVTLDDKTRESFMDGIRLSFKISAKLK